MSKEMWDRQLVEGAIEQWRYDQLIATLGDDDEAEVEESTGDEDGSDGEE